MNRTIKDTWLRVIGISLFSALSILSDEATQPPYTNQSVAPFALNVARIVLVWYLNRALIAYFHYEVLLRTATAKRLCLTLLACLGATTLFFVAFEALRHVVLHCTLSNVGGSDNPVYIQFGASRSIELTTFGVAFFHAFFHAVFYLTVYELLFYQQDSSRYRAELVKSEREMEQLRMANMQSQLDVLKQQVNPHFLFNSLNTLSSLISEDPHQAEVFVDKLSGVYRYVLRANRGDRSAGAGPEHHLTTLAAELEFIEAYYHLLQTRYGTGLSLTVEVDERQHSCQLPPLTLQLLVENAVKHNVVSPKRPLSIIIATDEQGRLVVQNTLQRKTTRVLSNGVGLANIVAKYQMLNLAQPSIEESPAFFTVRLPLLSCPDGGKPRQFLEP